MRVVNFLIVVQVFIVNLSYLESQGIPKPVFGGSCKYDTDCNTFQQVSGFQCSICAEDENGKGRCLSSFFTIGHYLSQCKISTTCSLNCSTGNTCELGGKTYLSTCFCKGKGYGRLCTTLRAGISGLRMLQWRRENLFTRPGEKRNFYYRSVGDAKVIESGLYRVFRTNFGYTHNPGEAGKKGMTKPTECMAGKGVVCTEDYTELQFPYLLPNNEYGVTILKMNDRLKGYLASIEGRFKSESMNMFVKYNFNVFVSYEQVSVLKCLPVIQLTNCARSFEGVSSFSFHRNEYVTINYNVKYLEDGAYLSTAKESLETCTSTDTIWTWTWSRYYVKNGLETHGEEKTKIGTYTKIVPFTLDYGSYIVSLRIKRVVSASTNENYDQCYFRVTPLPLEASIDGGQVRKVIKDAGLALTAMNSYDPNLPSYKQDTLKMLWTCECLTKQIPNCENSCKFNKKEPYRWIKVYDHFYIYPDKLQYEAEYKFTVRLHSTLPIYSHYTDISPQFCSIIVKVANESEKMVVNYHIECVQNCGKESALPNEVLFLKARAYEIGESIENNNTLTEFDWMYAKKNDSIHKSVDLIKLEGLPSSMLAIKADSLEQGVTYSIILSDHNTSEYLAEYTFTTSSVNYEGKCTVEPQSGTKGLSDFDITCSGSDGFIFEFYDKSEKDMEEKDVYNGRMLGTSEFVGSLTGVKLTRGNVVIYVVQKATGLYATRILKVELSPWDISAEVMEGVMENLSSTVRLGDLSTTMNYISFIPDILPEWMDKSEIFEKLLLDVYKNKIYNPRNVKLSASTMKSVLETFNKPKPLSIDFEVIRGILQRIRVMTKIMAKAAQIREVAEWISSQEVRQVAKTLLDILNIVNLVKDASAAGLEEVDMGFDNLFLLKEMAKETENIIDKVKDTLSFIQAPGMPPSKLTSSDNTFQIWTMGDDEDNRVSKMLENNAEIPIFVPKYVSKAYSKERENGIDQYFQVTTIERNLFSWSQSDVKSKLVSLSVGLKYQDNYIEKVSFLPSPIYVRIESQKNLTNTTVKGIAQHLDPHLDPTDCDISLKIHRIDSPPKAMVEILFLFPPTNGSLRVLVLQDYRPDCETVIKDSFIITSSDPKYPEDQMSLDDREFLYMAVLPTVNISSDETVTYEFQVTIRLCQLWLESQWSSIGCLVSTSTQHPKDTVCACSHLSIIGAAFPVPPQAVDPFGDAKLFMTVFDNPLVVLFVTFLFIIYLILVLWGRYKDKADEYKGRVVILEDNFPEDEFPYLVAIHTGSRFNAGTTAHVGIQLMGKGASSRAHILACPWRKILQRNSDDWFVIFAPKPLGEVFEIQIWHDNEGSSPAWYCDKIVVYDLTNRTETVFIVEQWLALKEDDYPEAILVIASDSDMLSIKRMFLDNAVIGFRDSHIILSIFVRHPRSQVTRVQRLSILMCFIMVAMLCSIMFYVPEDSSHVDDYQYGVGMRQLIISIETLVVTLLLVGLVMFSFRKSYKVSQKRQRTTLLYRKEEFEEATSRLSRSHPSKGSKKTFYHSYVRYVTKYLKNPPLAPVYINHGENILEKRFIWYTIAWFSCIVVMLGAGYLVMLYGLKLGKVQSEKWLTTLVMSLGEDVFLATPGKIIFIAILLSIAFQQSTKVDLHGIHLEEVMAARPENDHMYISLLLARRTHPMYFPLSTQARAGKDNIFRIIGSLKYREIEAVCSRLVVCTRLIVASSASASSLLATAATISSSVNVPATTTSLSTSMKSSKTNRENINKSVMLEKKAIRRKYWGLIDFVNIVCFVIVVSMVIYRLWTSQYHGVNHLKVMFSHTHRHEFGSADLEYIGNISMVNTYFEITFFEILFNIRWYNGAPMTTLPVEPQGIRRFWAMDSLYKMIGKPTITQNRVVPYECSNVYFPKMKFCLLKWSLKNKDKNIYGERWSPAAYKDTIDDDSPWSYMDKSSAMWWTNQRFYGIYGTLYDVSGYSTSIGPTMKAAQLTIDELRENKWQDWFTRACYLTGTVYNINDKVFSQVTVLFEYFVDGSMSANVSVLPVSSKIMLGMWEFFFLFYTIYYVFRSGYLINHMGFMDYHKNASNATRSIQVVLTYVVIVIWCAHHTLSVNYAESYMKMGHDNFFDFDKFSDTFQFLRISLSLLMCVVFLRSFLLLQGGRRFLNVYYTCIVSRTWLCWLSLGLFLLIFILSRLQFLLHCQIYFRKKEIIIPQGITDFMPGEALSQRNVQVFLLLMALSMYFVRVLFVVLFYYYVRIARVYRLRDSDSFDFVSFITERLKICFVRKSSKLRSIR